MSAPVLSFHEVTFGYGHGAPGAPPAGSAQSPGNVKSAGTVLTGVSFEVPRGGVTAVIGPNGAGKTTILHLALGWLRAQRGEVSVDGRPVHLYSQRERGRWMSLVPQKEHIPFEYTIAEYVMLGRAPYLRSLEMPGDEDERAVLDSIESVGLGGMAERSIDSLSAGERQLLFLARALAQRPRILLLDEPTSHLDLLNRKRIIDILATQKTRGRTILLTTHELDLASVLADHIVVVRSRGVLASGAPEKVLIGEFLSEAYGLEVRVVEVEGIKVVLWL